MKTFNAVSCIKFGTKELKILVFDLLTKKVLWRKVFTYDFEVFDNSGVIKDPIRAAAFIRNVFNEYKLPKKVRVSLSSEYLNLNTLFLPSVPVMELQQIILDEAIHQSIYSFTDERVAVAYLILKDKIFENGILNTEVLTVTTLQRAINQISEVFNNTGLELETITPTFWGVSQYLTQKLTGLTKPINLILISNNDAEFFTWDGYPCSCHYINAGTKELPRLQNEVTVSLEHFNKKTRNEDFGPQILVVGEKCELKLGAKYAIDYLYDEEWPDLLGLALITKNLHDLNFLTKIPVAGFDPITSIVHKFWPFILGSLVCLNILMSWNCWFSVHQRSELNNEDLHLKNLFLTLNQQFNYQKAHQMDGCFEVHMLLEKLRQIVPEDMIFTNLVIDIENKNMQIEGFCLSQKNLDVFLNELSEIKGVKSIDNLESSQQIKANFTGSTFRINLTFIGDFHNGQ